MHNSVSTNNSTETMVFIVFKLSFVAFIRQFSESAGPMSLIIQEFSFVYVTRSKYQSTIAWHLVIFPIAFVKLAPTQESRTFTMPFAFINTPLTVIIVLIILTNLSLLLSCLYSVIFKRRLKFEILELLPFCNSFSIILITLIYATIVSFKQYPSLFKEWFYAVLTIDQISSHPCR